MSTYNETQIAEVKRLLCSGADIAEIVELTGVHDAVIYDVKRDGSWLNVPWPCKKSQIKKLSYKLTAKDYEGMRKDIANEMPSRRIAVKYGITTRYVNHVKKRDRDQNG